MKIKICSQKAAEKLLQGRFPDNTAVISFYNSPYPTIYKYLRIVES